MIILNNLSRPSSILSMMKYCGLIPALHPHLSFHPQRTELHIKQHPVHAHTYTLTTIPHTLAVSQCLPLKNTIYWYYFKLSHTFKIEIGILKSLICILPPYLIFLSLKTDLHVVVSSCELPPTMQKVFCFFSSVRAMFPNNSPPATSIFMRASSSIHELSCLFIILLTNISTLPPSSTLTLLKWNTRSIETIRLSLAQVSLPPKATPCLARSLQTGSTTQGPSILIFPGPPPRLVPSIISAPFSFHRVPTKAANQKKSQKKGGEEYNCYHAEQCWLEDCLLSRAMHLLAWSLLQTQPSSLREQQPLRLGGWVWFWLKQYIVKVPLMAPWSPANPSCWAVKRGGPGHSPCIHRHTLWGAVRAPNSWLGGPKRRGSPCSADLTTEALSSGTIKLRWGGGLGVHLQGTLNEMEGGK